MTTDGLNLGGYSDLRVSFSYYPWSFEGSEDFFVEYNDGGGWVVIANYVNGVDFSNNGRENVSIETGSLNLVNSGTLRIRCDASGNGDRVYIDTMMIEAK